jgi:hypothetical protein
MAALAALMQSQVTALQRANEAINERRKRKRKALQSDRALSVAKAQAAVIQNHVKAGINEEMLMPKKRISKCSGYGQQDRTIRTCKSRE